MNYENFDRVKVIMEQIKKYNDLVGDLTGDNVSVKLMSGQYSFMTIGSWDSCEHSCQELAEKFVSSLTDYYTRQMQELHSELRTL